MVHCVPYNDGRDFIRVFDPEGFIFERFGHAHSIPGTILHRHIIYVVHFFLRDSFSSKLHCFEVDQSSKCDDSIKSRYSS